MKKQTKKLVLSKETVRDLEASALGKAAGGATVLCTTDPFRFCPNMPNKSYDVC
ncbi:MAG TPA: class I lanthipeptide [Thermoanaerobaculia bacterium]|nr:class I lanthipeptide [Thermoanaerobaculia bacterium]